MHIQNREVTLGLYGIAHLTTTISLNSFITCTVFDICDKHSSDIGLKVMVTHSSYLTMRESKTPCAAGRTAAVT